MFTKILGRIQYWLTPLTERLPSACFPRRPRRTWAYCIGTPRSGTVSMCEMFNQNFRAAHEPESRFLTNRVMDYLHGTTDRGQLLAYLARRDRRLGLEMESSYINFEIVDLLVRMSPESKFILTIRDCRSWLDSFVNLLLNKPEYLTLRKTYAKRHMQWRLGNDKYSFNSHDRIFEDLGLFPLESFLDYWTFHNNVVLSQVPKERLLVVKTEDIGSSAQRLEQFLALAAGTLKPEIKANPAIARHFVLDKLDQRYLQDKIDEHCGQLMHRFFPPDRGAPRL